MRQTGGRMNMKCKNCGAEMVITGDIIVLPDGYELEDYKCKECDKFKVIIEGSEHYFRYVDDVIDQIQSDTHFEVDSEALRADLKHLNKNDTIELRYDCIVKRIA